MLCNNKNPCRNDILLTLKHIDFIKKQYINFTLIQHKKKGISNNNNQAPETPSELVALSMTSFLALWKSAQLLHSWLAQFVQEIF